MKILINKRLSNFDQTLAFFGQLFEKKTIAPNMALLIIVILFKQKHIFLKVV